MILKDAAQQRSPDPPTIERLDAMQDLETPPGYYCPLLVEEQPGEWTPTGQVMVGENHSAVEVALCYREEHPGAGKLRVAVIVPPEES